MRDKNKNVNRAWVKKVPVSHIKHVGLYDVLKIIITCFL